MRPKTSPQSAQGPVGGSGAQGDPRGFGGLGPASPEGSDFQRAAVAPPQFD